jgi:hypothetical protein
VTRSWLLVQGPSGRDSRVLDGPTLKRESIHPLRCLYLGLLSPADALAKARTLAPTEHPASIIAANIRAAVDRRLLKRFRLSEQELDLLRTGHPLHLRDSLGSFTVGYENDAIF